MDSPVPMSAPILKHHDDFYERHHVNWSIRLVSHAINSCYLMLLVELDSNYITVNQLKIIVLGSYVRLTLSCGNETL